MTQTVFSFISGLSWIELCGWFGSLCLAGCALPQVVLCVKQRHANGVSNGLVWLWMLGEVFTLVFLLSQPMLNWPLIANYSANILFVSVIVWYKLFPEQGYEALADSIERAQQK